MSVLIEAARRVQRQAYAPYSGFRVGCALRGSGGRIFVGANVENAAYPLGHCAERSALLAMIAAGETRIAEVAVVGSGDAPCAPCGGCRQMLSEFAAADVPIHMAGRGVETRSATMAELLPFAFGPADLDGAPSRVHAQENDPFERTRATGPRLGIVLGSGLAAVIAAIEDRRTIDPSGPAGLPPPSVEGHARRLHTGTIAGLPVACLEGRVHLYEGDAAAPLRLVRLLHDLGCETLLVTSAVGGIRDDLEPGAIVVVDDHLNLTGQNPLVGADDDPDRRFPDMTAAYDPLLREVLDRSARDAGLDVAHGVFAGVLGPSFETPAEIAMLRRLGGDVVGMSTVAETIAAARCGLRTAALAIVVNRAAGAGGGTLTHAHTLAEGDRAAPRLAALIEAFCRRLANEGKDGR